MLKSQAMDKLKTDVARLQSEARTRFFDRMMYEINDSLTSILAITEVEPKDAIPRIKKYINRINQSLHNTKSYQINSTGEGGFSMNHVLKNLIQVLVDNYPQTKVASDLSEIKAPVQGNQSSFERLFLSFCVDGLNTADGNADLLVDVHQKGQDAVVTLIKDHFILSDEAREVVQKIIEADADLKGRVVIQALDHSAEVSIRLPLKFSKVQIIPGQKEPQTESQKILKK